MLIVDNVTKFYGTYKVLDQISLRAQKGEVIGVIGSNGAGKSTFLNFLSGNLCPEQGCLVFNGADVYVDPLFYKSRVGFQTQRPAVMKDMRVFDFLKYVSQLKDIEGFQVMVQKILKDCQLSQVANYRIGELSEGYIQRVNLAQALLGNPEVLIFD
ncbi:MAG: ATP-binding cassette domain-containing protein, partial [Bdellovibrionales bacterium]|nr:ATP-binding cassette domain-containing protein [Bdellovibrionales bacterium]